MSNNDLLLVAFTKTYKLTVVTYEGEQGKPPDEKCNCKILLVCEEEGVYCINPVELFTELNISA